MEYLQIIRQIQNKQYAPVYFLEGEEPYFIDVISDEIEKSVLQEHEKEFNLKIVYGNEITGEDVIQHARHFPVMADYQVIIVKEAQSMKKLERMEAYMEKPVKSTILVFCYKHKSLDKRKKIAKLVKKNGILFHAKSLYENQVMQWLEQYIQSKGYKITPKAKVLFIESVGTRVSVLVNEMNKVLINLPEGTSIDENILEEQVGISKEYNVFELQNAIGMRDVKKALKIVNYFVANFKKHPMVFTVSTLYSYLIKILIYKRLEDKSGAAKELGVHPFFVKDYEKAAARLSYIKLFDMIHILKEYDGKDKGVNSVSSKEEVFREMVLKLLN